MGNDGSTKVPDKHGVVVVGAGLAGVTAASTLRANGYAGRIVLLGDEPHAPYDRPPLSKEVLSGDAGMPALPVDVAQLEVEQHSECRATAIGDGFVCTSAGEIPFDALVVATGSRPVPLPGAADGLYTLRTFDDALALRGKLRPGAEVVVVGAGWLGAEIASTAASLGCRVTVVEAGPTVLPKVLGAEVGPAIERWYGEAGVDLILGSRVRDVRDGAVHLHDGTRLPADLVVAAVGATPDTGWLAGSGVARDAHGGILVDEFLASSMPGVYAVGDCAAYPSHRYGRRMRVEHWSNAQQSGMAVATNILGRRQPYDPVPYFWSKQFGRMVQYVGAHAPGDEPIWRGSPEEPRWSVCWARGDEVTAVLAVNKPRDIADARRLLRTGPRFSRGDLGDASKPLAACAR